MSDLAADLVAFLTRFRAELAYNDAKGQGPYRQGMHDGLHFAADALSDVLASHGFQTLIQPSSTRRIPEEYGVE